MAKIRLSRKAIAVLDSIWDYTVETWSEDQAIIYYRQLYTAIQGLNSLPVFLEKEYNVVKPGLFGFKVTVQYWLDDNGTDLAAKTDTITVIDGRYEDEIPNCSTEFGFVNNYNLCFKSL